MRILIFTLVLSLASLGLFAQEWNITDPEFNALGTLTETTIINGLTIYATEEKDVTVDDNSKSINGMDFEYRLKLGGSGTFEEGVPVGRVVSFDIPANATLSIALQSSSSSSDRELLVVDANTEDTLTIMPALGETIGWVDYEYEGEATTLWVYSKSSGINLYYIKAEAPTIPVEPADPLAIFDPAEVDPATLPDGMSIVEIDGKTMLQVVVDGWNSIIDVPEFTFEPGMKAFAEFKYVVAQEDFAASQINAAVQLIDTVNLMTVSWSPDPLPTTTGLIQSNPSGEFVKTSAAAAPTMRVVHQVQFFGQETSSWGAVAGDTLWVGKVRAYKVDENTIFDPATYDPDELVDGMEIVEIDGKKMLQVVVNGWNSTLDIPEFTFEEGDKAFATFKYVVAQEDFTASQINAAVQLIDTVNLMTVSWSDDPVASTTGIIQSNPSGEFVRGSADISETMKVAHQVQFFGQETSSWGAVAGDTMWVGKVRAYKVDENTIFDPATYDPDDFTDGMELVEIDGETYLKVVVDGWNSILDVPEFTLPENVKAKCTFKYTVGQTEYTASQINAAVQLIDTVNLMTVSWSPDPVASTTGIIQSNPSGEFVEKTADIAATMKVVHQVQFFGQETSSWGAVAGDTMWVGKVTVEDATPPDPNIIIDPATFDGALGEGWEIVEIDGESYFKVAVDGWNSWMNVPEYTFPEGKNAFHAQVMYEAGTSGAALDGLKIFLKFSDSGWTEIGAGSASASTEFKDYVVTLASNEGNVAGVFQVAIQDANNGWSAISGDFMYISKVTAVTTAPITFVIDDTKYKMYDGFSIRGSWLTESGLFDSEWNDGVNHAEFADSTEANPVPDNIWEYTVDLVADGGANIWHWGFLDLEDNWLVTGDDPSFTVVDETPQTLTYVVGGTNADLFANPMLKVYPNPATSTLFFNSAYVSSVDIYTLTGAKVLNATSNRIDISGLNNGSYIVKIHGNEGDVVISKFVKR
jgi:fructosamine-3-kinase